ncbi:unnamed protein product [Acanthoscelides obtectus]|uniref:Mos1 transposase HTH domain-containing protein n=1 Tax=Acanthoscelides obtectus TaxID=200917 RepID=A0A9P0Q5B3_ACAOB|nr:unnamed protein product [Acanthoscelides obtectus]CAK1689082.1 Histone-lysine N-methyltransferase SETMAR [Acanthoscelides obtectus]
MELNREHFRAIIYYKFQRKLSQQECLAELLSVFGNEAPHQSTISRWYGEFKRGRVSLSDDPGVGAPKTAVTQENVDAVRKLIIEDRHVTYHEIKASLKIPKTSIQKYLHEELRVRKLVSRWIPHLLTEEQKPARVNWCQKTLDPLHISDVESWIYFIRSRSVSKKMVTTFVSKDGTVTADWYTTICLPKFITELRIINPDRRIILHQDNASSQAQKTRHPDLNPNDFSTFPKIENSLRGQRFKSPEEAVEAFKNARMQMCINLRGEYFEKQ